MQKNIDYEKGDLHAMTTVACTSVILLKVCFLIANPHAETLVIQACIQQ